MEIKYIYNKTPLGWVWQVEIDGQKLFYPCGDIKGMEKFVKSNLDLLVKKLNSTDNCGLAFLACGYNGQSQNDFINYWKNQGVSVF